MEYPGIHSSLTSWKTAGWHERATGTGSLLPDRHSQNSSSEHRSQVLYQRPACIHLPTYLYRTPGDPYKDLSSVFRGNDMWPHFLRISQNPQRRLILNIFSEHFCVSGMRSIKIFIESAEPAGYEAGSTLCSNTPNTL